MSADAVVTDLAALMPRLAARAPRGWKLMFVNYEFKDHDQGAVSNTVVLAVTKPWLRPAKKVQIETGANEWQLLNRICRVFCAQTGQAHLTLDIVVRPDGTYKTYVDYEMPTRLSGDLLNKDRYKRYVQEYPLLA